MKNKVLNMLTVCSILMGATGTAFAAEENPNIIDDVHGETPFEITFTENDGEEGSGGLIDPSDPEDPENPAEPDPSDPTGPSEPGGVLPPKNGLVALVKAPEKFNFKSKLQPSGVYQINATAEDVEGFEGSVEGEYNIGVFSSNSQQGWQVWAGIDVDASLNEEESDIEITQFYINNQPIHGTARGHLVFKSTDEGVTGTGLQEKKVERVGVEFKDEKFQINAESHVKSTVHYKLVNWATTE